MRDYKAWWQDDKLRNCWPGDGLAGGWDETAWIKDNIAPLLGPDGIVIDYGCGPGRHTLAFTPYHYLGVDLNPYAIDAARENTKKEPPNYRFQVIDFLQPLAPCDVILAWTVLLHIHDEDLPKVLDQFTAAKPEYIVIGEIMDRRWREVSPPNGPFYQRDLDDYLQYLDGRYYTLVRNHRIPYARYVRREASDIFEVAVFQAESMSV